MTDKGKPVVKVQVSGGPVKSVEAIDYRLKDHSTTPNACCLKTLEELEAKVLAMENDCDKYGSMVPQDDVLDLIRAAKEKT